MSTHTFTKDLIAALMGLTIIATPTLSRAGVKNFMAALNAAQETPPVASPAMGNALLTFDESTKMLCYSIAYQGLVAAEIVAHIHGPAPIGTPAGIVFPLPLGNPKSGCVGPLAADQKNNLLKNLLYINVHSAAFPAGEVRGQILRIK